MPCPISTALASPPTKLTHLEKVNITPWPTPPPATLPLDPPKQVCLQHWHGALTPTVADPEGVKVIQSNPPSRVILPLEPLNKEHLRCWHASPPPLVAGPQGVNSMHKIEAPIDESLICPRSPPSSNPGACDTQSISSSSSTTSSSIPAPNTFAYGQTVLRKRKLGELYTSDTVAGNRSE